MPTAARLDTMPESFPSEDCVGLKSCHRPSKVLTFVCSNVYVSYRAGVLKVLQLTILRALHAVRFLNFSYS